MRSRIFIKHISWYVILSELSPEQTINILLDVYAQLFNACDLSEHAYFHSIWGTRSVLVFWHSVKGTMLLPLKNCAEHKLLRLSRAVAKSLAVRAHVVESDSKFTQKFCCKKLRNILLLAN